jgi:hypothetical protein
MTNYFKNSLTTIWVFLSLITLGSWWMGASGNSASSDHTNEFISMSVLAFAAIKTRFVIRNYMEVKHAPTWLRWSCDAWLLYVFGMILAFYWLSR